MACGYKEYIFPYGDEEIFQTLPGNSYHVHAKHTLVFQLDELLQLEIINT